MSVSRTFLCSQISHKRIKTRSLEISDKMKLNWKSEVILVLAILVPMISVEGWLSIAEVESRRLGWFYLSDSLPFCLEISLISSVFRQYYYMHTRSRKYTEICKNGKSVRKIARNLSYIRV